MIICFQFKESVVKVTGKLMQLVIKVLRTGPTVSDFFSFIFKECDSFTEI